MSIQENTEIKLKNVASQTTEELLNPENNKKFWCCISYKWCFAHLGFSGNTTYDEDTCLCCRCLDCCSWCLEFNNKTNWFCRYKMVCFGCCCSIFYN